MIDKKLGAAFEALQEISSDHHSGTIGDQQHLLEKLIQDGVYATISDPITFDTRETLRDKNGNRVNWDKVFQSSMIASQKGASPEILINSLLLNLNRKSSDRVVQDILTVVMNRTRPANDSTDSALSPENSTYIDVIVNHVSNLHGVTKVQVLEENFPDSASIIVKLDLDNFTEHEQMKVLSKIDDIITVNKPKALDRLEVIYHNKVVYV